MNNRVLRRTIGCGLSGIFLGMLTVFFLAIPVHTARLVDLSYFLFGAGQCLNAFLFVPQSIRIFSKRKAEGLSIVMFAGFNLLQAMGLLFTHAVGDIYAIVGYSVSLVLCGLVTAQIMYYQQLLSKAKVYGAYGLLVLFVIAINFIDVSGWDKRLIFIGFGLGQFINASLYLPQLLRLYQYKKADEISLTMYYGFNILQGFGILFARAAHDAYAVVGYVCALVLCGAVASLALYYKLAPCKLQVEVAKLA